MPSRRQVLGVAGAALFAGCGASGDGATEEPADTTTAADAAETTATRTDTATPSPTATPTATEPPLSFSTDAFADGELIPETYTFDGEDVSPPLSIEEVPSEAETLALVVEDPDANFFVHWVLWNVPADVAQIPEGVPQTETVDELDGARQGKNDFGELGYRGPKPPVTDGAHTYRFDLYALSETLELTPGASRQEFDAARDGVTLTSARTTGEYERSDEE